MVAWSRRVALPVLTWLLSIAGQGSFAQQLTATGSVNEAKFAPSAGQLSLPSLRITAGDLRLTAKKRTSATLRFSSADDTISYLPGKLGQDNTGSLLLGDNAARAKPSYELELNSAADLLSPLLGPCTQNANGCEPTRRYLLLANADDRSLLRHWSALALASALLKALPNDSPAASTFPSNTREPRSAFLELFLNGRYEGCYQLMQLLPLHAEQPVALITAASQDSISVRTEQLPYTLASNLDADQAAVLRERAHAALDALSQPSSAEPKPWRTYLSASAVDVFLLDSLLPSGVTTTNEPLLTQAAGTPLLSLHSLLTFTHSSAGLPDLASDAPLAQTASAWDRLLYADPDFRSEVARRWELLKADGDLTAWLGSLSTESSYLRQARLDDTARWPATGAATAKIFGDPADVFLNWVMLRVGFLDAVLTARQPTSTSMLPTHGLLTKGATVTLSSRMVGDNISGEATFLCDGSLLGTARLDSAGLATLNVAHLPSSNCTLQVIYGGDGVHAMSGALASVAPAALQDSSGSQSVATSAIPRTASPGLPVATPPDVDPAVAMADSSSSAASPSPLAAQTKQAKPKQRADDISAPVSTVENLGAIPVGQVLSGLGWNVSTQNAWEFEAAASAGAKHVRFQCSWGDAFGGRGGGGELQSPPPANVSQGYQMPAGCAQGIALSKQYGIKPTILAAYGPPFEQILTLSTSTATPAGATSVQVTFVSGVGGDTLNTVAYPNDYLSAPSINGFLSPLHSYAGTLISGITLQGSTQATIALASATQTSLPAGTRLNVNRALYPSAASDAASDPSLQAYIGFVRFLGNHCAAAGIACEIEIWNEPPWPDECWDNRGDCFDQNLRPTLKTQPYGPNWGFVSALNSMPPIPGVNYDWAGTHKTGDGTTLGPNMQQYTGSAFAQPNSAVTIESLHPYGNNPEDNMWNEPCLVALKTTWNWTACNTVLTSSSNADEGEARAILARQTNASYGIAHGITETGFAGTSGDDTHKTRFVMRQFLGFMAANIQFVEFYRMFDSDSSTNFSFLTYTNGVASPLPAYTALAGLMSDLATVRNAPVSAINTAALPSVVSYTGAYPLDIAHYVGARPGDTANSDFVTVWQRSYSSLNSGWAILTSPAPAPVTLTRPTGMSVSQVINLVSRVAVPYTGTSQQVTFNVTDDPVEVLYVPTAGAPPTIAITPVSISDDSSTATLSATVNFSGKVAPTGALTFSIDNGTPIGSSCSETATSLTCAATVSVDTLTVATHTLSAQLAADTSYSAASGTSTLVVSQAAVSLNVSPLSVTESAVSADASATIAFQGSKAPTGPVNFTLDTSSPIAATCSGSTSPITCTASLPTASLAPGSHVLTASFAGNAEFAPASATATLSVLTAGPTTPTSPTGPSSPSTPTTAIVTTSTLSLATTGKSTAPAILQVQVTPASTANGTLSGKVTIYSRHSRAIWEGTLNVDGTVTWTVPRNVARNTVYAVFGGNSQYRTSTSTSLNLATAIARLNDSE